SNVTQHQGEIDHGSIAGLSDDDHSQYALLAGRSGGQTLYGSTDSGESLTLAGTSHSTPGPTIVPNTIQLPITTVTANTTLTAAHYTVLCSNASDITISLPAAAGCTGRVYVVKKTGSNTATVTIDPNGSETVDGATSYVLYVAGDYAVIQ